MKKAGFPFFIVRYKKRFGFLIGMALFLAALKLMSCFIWSVEVSGNKKVPTESILAACERLGIHEGVLKSSVNTNILKQELLLDMESLAWAALNIEGCRLNVNVTEVLEKSEDNDVPTNLKATADGIIKKIDVVTGNCVVKVGDTVKAGDILVSGIIEKSDSTEFVHSIGSVIANTERSISVSAEYIKETETETGNKSKKSVLGFFGIKLPLFLGKENRSYNSTLSVKEVKLFGKRLPISIYTREFRYTEKKSLSLTREELIAELDKKFEAVLNEKGIVNYKVTDRQITDTDNGLCLTAAVTAEEDIAYQDILIFNSAN